MISLYKGYLLTAIIAMLISSFLFHFVLRPVATLLWTLGIIAVAALGAASISVMRPDRVVAGAALRLPSFFFYILARLGRHKAMAYSATPPTEDAPVGEMQDRGKITTTGTPTVYSRQYDSLEEYYAAFRDYESREHSSFTEVEIQIYERHLLKITQELRSLLGLALEHLSPRDRAILQQVYRLDQVGLGAPERSHLADLTPVARRVAVYRARHRFLQSLESIFEDASRTLSETEAIDNLLYLIRQGQIRAKSASYNHNGGYLKGTTPGDDVE